MQRGIGQRRIVVWMTGCLLACPGLFAASGALARPSEHTEEGRTITLSEALTHAEDHSGLIAAARPGWPG